MQKLFDMFDMSVNIIDNIGELFSVKIIVPDTKLPNHINKEYDLSNYHNIFCKFDESKKQVFVISRGYSDKVISKEAAFNLTKQYAIDVFFQIIEHAHVHTGMNNNFYKKIILNDIGRFSFYVYLLKILAYCQEDLDENYHHL